MFVAIELVGMEGEEVKVVLLLDCAVHGLFTQFVVELVGKSFSSVETLFGRIDEDLVEEVEQ
jgi:hypothetical protein